MAAVVTAGAANPHLTAVPPSSSATGRRPSRIVVSTTVGVGHPSLWSPALGGLPDTVCSSVLTMGSGVTTGSLGWLRSNKMQPSSVGRLENPLQSTCATEHPFKRPVSLTLHLEKRAAGAGTRLRAPAVPV